MRLKLAQPRMDFSFNYDSEDQLTLQYYTRVHRPPSKRWRPLAHFNKNGGAQTVQLLWLQGKRKGKGGLLIVMWRVGRHEKSSWQYVNDDFKAFGTPGLVYHTGDGAEQYVERGETFVLAKWNTDNLLRSLPSHPDEYNRAPRRPHPPPLFVLLILFPEWFAKLARLVRLARSLSFPALFYRTSTVNSMYVIASLCDLCVIVIGY